MISRLWTALLLSLSCASAIAWLVAFMHEKGVRPVRELVGFFRRQTKAGRVILGAFFVVLWVIASVKPGGGGGGDGGDGGGGTNNVQMVVGNVANVGVLPISITNSNFTAIDSHHGQLTTGNIGTGNTFTLATLEITSANTTRTLTADDFERGFVLTRVGTNEVFDFSAPASATVCADWRAFGAAKDWIYVAITNWAFKVATNDIGRLRVFSFGKVEPLVREADNAVATNHWFAPFMASLGVVPEANWGWLDEADRPSLLWYAVTPEGSLLVTWQNALLDRDTEKPVSFQAEFKPGGQFIYRYDLSRCGVRGAPALPGDGITNVVVGASFAGNEWTTNALATNVTSMAFYPLSDEDVYNRDPDGDGIDTIDELFVHFTDPRRADTDLDGLSDYEELFVHCTDPLDPHSLGSEYCDGLVVKLGGLDPFSFPEGSTNTVLEHIFYTGTTNAPFAYPQPSDETAVLKVMVSGNGTGRLVVGDAVVPLVGFQTGLTGFTGLRGEDNPVNPVNPVTNP